MGAGEPDLADDLAARRGVWEMRYFRIYWHQSGGYTDTTWYSGGRPDAVLGCLGSLRFVNDEWDAMLLLLLDAPNVEFRHVERIEEAHA